MAVLLEMRNIRKQYPGVLALDDVPFDLNAGEVHCLVGENGAGKSTLMKILSGALQKDSGQILIDGSNVKIASPSESRNHGIGIIYQDFKLVPELNVAENVLLGNEPTRGKSPFLDRPMMHNKTRSVLMQLGESIDTTALVGSLSVAQQQIVEIAKAISRKVRILAMDEPSAPLTEKELVNLFRVIRTLKAEGVGIIYISHRLEEIFEIGDRVTVLRDGKFVQRCNISDADRTSLIHWMVGRDLEKEKPKLARLQGSEILRIENVGGRKLRNISLTVHRGEILGLGGLVGARRSELARIIFGADPRESGRIFLDGRDIHPRSPRETIDLGIGLLTEDRNRYGLMMQMSVKENISLSNLRDTLTWFFIDNDKEESVARKYIDGLRIKTTGSNQRVENLSGGNRQKVVLARWLYTRSKLLIFDEPTSGIDIGVKYEIYTIINKLAEDGIGVIVISSDLPELLSICDHIAVMCEGTIAGILSRDEFSSERFMMLATGSIEEGIHAT